MRFPPLFNNSVGMIEDLLLIAWFHYCPSSEWKAPLLSALFMHRKTITWEWYVLKWKHLSPITRERNLYKMELLGWSHVSGIEPLTNTTHYSLVHGVPNPMSGQHQCFGHSTGAGCTVQYTVKHVSILIKGWQQEGLHQPIGVISCLMAAKLACTGQQEWRVGWGRVE